MMSAAHASLRLVSGQVWFGGRVLGYIATCGADIHMCFLREIYVYI